MTKLIPIQTVPHNSSLTFLLESFPETTGSGRKHGSDVCTPHNTSVDKKYSEVVGAQVEVWTVPHCQQLKQ